MTGGSEPLLAIPSGVLLPDIGYQKKDQQSEQSRWPPAKSLIGLNTEVYVNAVITGRPRGH